MQVDLEFILWLHTHPFNPHEEGTCTHVDWEELAERLGLGIVLGRGQRARARERLVKAYEHAVKGGYLVRFDLDQLGGFGKIDRLVKNTAKLRAYSRCKALRADAEGTEVAA